MALEIDRPLLIYALHSGNMYGTERMAIATAKGLASSYECVIMAPEGPALEESRRLGFRAVPFQGARQFAVSLWKLLLSSSRIVFFATGVMHSLVCLSLNTVLRRKIAHLHMVHGGAEERLSYGRKKRLNGKPVVLVAVSSYVRDRLIANGAAPNQIKVIDNFLTAERVSEAAVRPPFDGTGISSIIVISRLDPEKRVDLLLESLEQNPALSKFSIRVFGTGWHQEQLQARALRSGLPVEFKGFHSNVAGELAKADLLVHLCPVEPFGLAILEAVAAHVPVLVPNAGGAGSLVEDNVSGFHFEANSSASLAAKILAVSQLPADVLNTITANAMHALDTSYSERARLSDYRRLIEENLS